jgi:hypothetical protein
LARAREDAQDLEKLNGASDELNAEAADVLEYQAVDEDLGRGSER